MRFTTLMIERYVLVFALHGQSTGQLLRVSAQARAAMNGSGDVNADFHKG